MKKEISRYTCVGDSGREYTVVEYQNFRVFRPLNGPSQEVPTTKELFLSDGRDVNWIDDNKFQIVITDEIVRKVT